MSPRLETLRATQRLQFHKDFTLDDAVALVPYFASLGISHIYASPLLKARAGSMHGYDVVDPRVINPELGGEPALRRLVSALREKGMGLILDIVSNHMAVGGNDNPWWLDLLEWGRRSPYADFFDIQWHSPDPLLKGQLLLPFLSTDYGTVLQAGEIPLRFDPDHGVFYIEHYQHHFPINPGTYGPLLESDENPLLDELSKRFAALDQFPQAWERARQARAELVALVKDKSIMKAIELAMQALKVWSSTASCPLSRQVWLTPATSPRSARPMPRKSRPPSSVAALKVSCSIKPTAASSAVSRTGLTPAGMQRPTNT